MNSVILHSQHVEASRKFVEQYPDVPKFDWFDFAQRSFLNELFGNVLVTGVPSVLIETPEWFQPEAFYGDSVVHFPSSVESIYNPSSWDEVEERIRFCNARKRGFIEFIDIPNCEILIWGSFPKPPEGYTTTFDGWDVNGEVATRKFRFDKLPTPSKPPVEVLGND